MAVADPQGRPIRTGAYPELTWTAVIVGWLIGALIALSIGYAALILGFSIEGSELAAILGWGVLRGVLRRTSIVENNINQTVASAVNGASAGIMFSVPAALILAKNSPDVFAGADAFNPYVLVLACIAGGLMGMAFVIPLRKQMIDFSRLAYPGGVAVAAILKSPGAGMRKSLYMLAGLLVAGGLHLIVILFEHDLQEHGILSGEAAPVGDWLGLPTFLNISFYVSLMTVGVGFIAGRGGLVFSYGGFICYFLLAPLLANFGSESVQDLMQPVAVAQEAGVDVSATEAETMRKGIPEALRRFLFRPTGIGMLIGAAIGGIIAAFPLIVSALKSMHTASKEKGATSDELPLNVLIWGVALGTICLGIFAKLAHEEVELWRAVAIAGLGALWIWIAGVIVAECVGRTNWSPLSGMTLIAVTILILICKGMTDPAIVITSIIAGGAICCAVSQASDMMLDLKSGYLIGAQPKMQQIAQAMGTWLGPILVVSLMFLLHKAPGGGIGEGKLSAPQATALATVIEGIMGGDAPAWRYTAGAGIGGLLAISGLGGVGVQIGLGFYMPFWIVMTYTVGCVIRMIVEPWKGRGFVESVGIPVAAGMIVGEALVGVGNAMYRIVVMSGGS